MKSSHLQGTENEQQPRTSIHKRVVLLSLSKVLPFKGNGGRACVNHTKYLNLFKSLSFLFIYFRINSSKTI